MSMGVTALTDLSGFETSGFDLVESHFDPQWAADFVSVFAQATSTSEAKGGVRNLLAIGQVRELAASPSVRTLVAPILGPEAFPVRGILFDKTADANWKVPWHQDVTVAVKSRIDADGFGPWSVKAGVLHVQPPAEVLERMLTVRIHLDDCPRENGALRVLPGTHRFGKIPEAEVAGWVERVPETVCELAAGGVLLMRPLLLHASSAATRVGHRRVIHLDFANTKLPNGLEWAEAQA